VHYKLKWHATVPTAQYFCSYFILELFPGVYWEEGGRPCYRWKKATFQFHDAYRSCISWRGGLASRQDERKEHQLAVSATRRGFPVDTSVGPTCYCTRLPIIPPQETLGLKHGCVCWSKMTCSGTLFKSAHVVWSDTAARYVGIYAECVLTL
jgi:hypothetical protein